MTYKPIVSVIMPNYNNEPYLVEAIDSVLGQSFRDFEFIIIDDGSTDNSIKIINSYKDKRINLILKKENSGIVDALNIGIENARGKYMIRMDGDDISVQGRFVTLVNFMESNPEIGVCSTDLKSFGAVQKKQIWRLGSSIERNKAEMIFSSAIGHASAIFRLSLFSKHNLRYEKGYPYIEDYKLYTRLNKLCDMHNINEPFYLVRINESSSTFINRATHGERLAIIYKELLDELGIGNDTELVNERKIRIHFELGKKQTPTGDYEDYFEWCKLLINKNNEHNVYPKNAFSDIVKERLRWVEFKLIEKKPFIVLNIFRCNKRVDKIQIKYSLGVIKNRLTKFE